MKQNQKNRLNKPTPPYDPEYKTEQRADKNQHGGDINKGRIKNAKNQVKKIRQKHNHKTPQKNPRPATAGGGGQINA